jgi:hypothetical protein
LTLNDAPASVSRARLINAAETAIPATRLSNLRSETVIMGDPSSDRIGKRADGAFRTEF